MAKSGMQTQTDVLVAGGGLAGYCAALSAAAEGASVLLVEKEARGGGSSIVSGGSFAFAATDLQADQGIADSTQQLFDELLEIGGGFADEALIRVYCEAQLPAYEWLKANGVRFQKVSLGSNMSVPRSHTTEAVQIFDALARQVQQTPAISFCPDTTVERLTSESGRVVGARLNAAGETWHVHAARGVVLATGGFARNRDLIEKFAPGMAKADPAGGLGTTGDGVMMGWSLGADLRDMSFINATFGMTGKSSGAVDRRGPERSALIHAMYMGAIIVNREGLRFCDESASYKRIGEMCLKQTDQIGFQIFDQRVMDRSEANPSAHDFAGAYAKGTIQSASTIDELAAAVGVYPNRLCETVARYNADIRAGSDTLFGRNSLSAGYGSPSTIETAPFFAIPSRTSILATYCGLHVNDRMEVIDVFAERISGLYAAGEVVGGFHGAGYMSGTALAKAAIYGRIAGHSASQRHDD